jgi:3-methyladenine DNA glycosylase/8-oxoguanine DNA glycosylase
LDTKADVDGFLSKANTIPGLDDLTARHPGIRLPIYVDSFEGFVRAILGQQISLIAARCLAGRLVRAFGEDLPTFEGQTLRLFPDAHRLASVSEDEVWDCGLTLAKARAIQGAAKAIVSGRLDLEALRTETPDQIYNALLSLPGIGPWTAAYIQMRAFGDRDVFLASDLGIKKALAAHDLSDSEIEAIRPWRSYLTLHLWESLSSLRLRPPQAENPARGADANRPEYLALGTPR